MSELKAFVARKIYDGSCDPVPCIEVYPKSEADKVIAELEESHKMEVEQLLILNREQANRANRLRDSMEQAIRRHKYKRCLAMAKWCMARYNEWSAHYPTTTTRKMKFLDKWERRWRNLAEKFKPNSGASDG